MNNRNALKKAISNIERFYPVIGITEKINVTLKVLEYELPEFFDGAMDVYYTDEDVRLNQNVNRDKPSVSDQIVNIIKKNFTNDLEFYDYCKQRLLQQFESIKL